MNQRQKGGDGSVNVQGESVSISVGANLEQMRSVANEVFRANALELREVAEEVALARAEKLVDQFIEELRQRDVEVEASLSDPDVQYGLYVAQESFARSGSKDLGETLVDLLVERCSRDNGSFSAVVLNEALATVRKLTSAQVAALTVNWLVTRVNNGGLTSRQDLALWLQQHVWPFIDDVPLSVASYEHLQYAGCAAVSSLGSTDLGRVLGLTYPGLFARGFSLNEIQPELQPFQDDKRVFGPCLGDPDKLQVMALNERSARTLAEEVGAPADALVRMLTRVMPNQEIVAWVQSLDEVGARLVDRWSNTMLQNMRVTTVGTAIAHSNWRRVVKTTEALEIWIQEE